MKNTNIEPTREQIIAACAGEDKDAAQFLSLFIERAHWLDDLADTVGPAGPAEIAQKEMAWLVVLSQNPFFLKHKERLTPLMLLSLNAWVDSDSLPAPERDVVKGFYHEVAYAVALLTGGWSRLRSVTSALRHYDFEPAASAYAGQVEAAFDPGRGALSVPAKGAE